MPRKTPRGRRQPRCGVAGNSPTCSEIGIKGTDSSGLEKTVKVTERKREASSPLNHAVPRHLSVSPPQFQVGQSGAEVRSHAAGRTRRPPVKAGLQRHATPDKPRVEVPGGGTPAALPHAGASGMKSVADGCKEPGKGSQGRINMGKWR